MSYHRSIRALVLFSLALVAALVATMGSPAQASDEDKIRCLRFIGTQGCKIGHEFDECGRGGSATGWWCRSTWGNDCMCFDYGTSKRGWWFALSSNWESTANGPLSQNTVTPFQLLGTAGNSFGVWDLLDEEPDSVSAEIHTAPNDLVGQFVVRLFSGSPDSIPARLEFLQMNIASFEVEGVPTGPNRIVLSSPSLVLGTYDSLQRVLDFNAPIQCTLFNDLFPAGHAIDIRPRAIPGSTLQRYLFNLSASLWIEDPSEVPAPNGAISAMAVYPNPAHSGARVVFTVPSDGQVSLDVFDVGGRFVRPLLQESVARGPRVVEWDGLDSFGRRVPPGIYFIEMRLGGGSSKSQRLTIVR